MSKFHPFGRNARLKRLTYDSKLSTFRHFATIRHVLDGYIHGLTRFTLAEHLKHHREKRAEQSGNESRCRDSDILGAKIRVDYEVTIENAARQEFSLHIHDFAIPADGGGWTSLKDRLR